MRYDWNLLNTSSYCVYVANFSTNHAMICRRGGLTFVRHNDLHDITAELLSKVCNDVAIEPPLQSLSGEVITPQSAIEQDDARANIHAHGFCWWWQSAFFDIRVFHPNVQSYRNASIPSVYSRHEQQKKRAFVF